jgi:hypothetical protein
VVVGDPGSPKADLRFTNFRTKGPVDTSLPLPKEQYQALSASALGGLMGGGGAAVSTAPRPPARSPFVRQPAAAPASPAGATGLPSIPIPGLSGMAPTGEQAQALSSIVSTLTKQLGQAMAPPPPGKQESGIPGLKLSDGTMKLLKHMQNLREGKAGGAGGGTRNPAQGMEALTGMLERLGSGARPGASVNPRSLDRASTTIQKLLETLRANRGAPAGGAGTTPSTDAMRNTPRRGLSGGRATSAEALKRMQELMQKLKRTAPVQGK